MKRNHAQLLIAISTFNPWLGSFRNHAHQQKGIRMKDLTRNPVIDSDSYKCSQPGQYPPGTEVITSYLASRGGVFRSTVQAGIQMCLAKMFGQPVTMEMVEEARDFFHGHMGMFPYDGWKYIVEKHGGNIPLHIKSVDEGSVVPVKNVLLTVSSTDPVVPWIVSWYETKLVRLWYPITVATQSYHIKKSILEYLKLSSDDPEAEINFKLHDFGSRGASCEEEAEIGGAAHLTCFMGSDTCTGIRAANHYYGSKMAGFSIPASEHSTITSWGRDNEVDAYRNMITQFCKPNALVACVSDSYDLWNAIENLWCGKLLDEVKESGACLVIRPDSGTPHEVVLKALQIMDRKVGTFKNTKGYKQLPKYFRIIQGDGINRDSINLILKTITDAGYSATNVAFGMGSALIHEMKRDTQQFAMKCSHIIVNGIGRDVYKDPVTDRGKSSMRGILDLVKEGGQYKTISGSSMASVLKTVYYNGHLSNEATLDQIRSRINQSILNGE